MSRELPTEERLQRLEQSRIADELEELNSHLLAYLETMALSMMASCNPTDAGQKGRDAAAIKLLRHVQESRG